MESRHGGPLPGVFFYNRGARKNRSSRQWGLYDAFILFANQTDGYDGKVCQCPWRCLCVQTVVDVFLQTRRVPFIWPSPQLRERSRHTRFQGRRRHIVCCQEWRVYDCGFVASASTRCQGALLPLPSFGQIQSHLKGSEGRRWCRWVYPQPRFGSHTQPGLPPIACQHLGGVPDSRTRKGRRRPYQACNGVSQLYDHQRRYQEYGHTGGLVFWADLSGLESDRRVCHLAWSLWKPRARLGLEEFAGGQPVVYESRL